MSAEAEATLLAKRIQHQSQNPFVQTIFTADPSAHVWADGRLYVYPSHDIDPARGCDFMDRYHVYSTADLVNWRDEGEILGAKDVEWGRPSGGFMWAPDCAYKNGTYYFYFPHPESEKWNDSWQIGVATSDKPATGFTSQGYIKGLGGDAMIDPAVFIDDDQTAYIYYGGGGHCKAAILADDMLSLKTEPVEMTGLHDFHEATWVFKREGQYYLTYSDNYWGNNHLCYATSDSPLGPWTYRGVYLAPTGCETSHGSVVAFKGQWLAFYHSDDLSHQGELRSICWDPLEFNADGTIKPVVETRLGHAPVGPAPVTDRDQLRIYGTLDAADTDHLNIGNKAAFYQASFVTVDANTPELRYENVEGFNGGHVNIGLIYGTRDELAKVRLFVNNTFVSLLNLPYTGSASHYGAFHGYANITVPLAAGTTNQIRLAQDTGKFSLEALVVENYEVHA